MILKNLESFENLSGEQVFNQRKTKFLKIGREQGFKKASDVLSEKLSYAEPGFSKFTRFIQDRKNLLLWAVIILVLATILSIFL